MKYTLPCILLVLTLELGSSVAQNNVKKQTTAAPATVNIVYNNDIVSSSTNKSELTTLKTNNNTEGNVTQKSGGSMLQKMKDNKYMLIRTFYVMLGVTSIVVVYFVVRAWRSKRRQNKSRKYGLLATSGADLEMEPLDRDVDDDDEMTMFERQR